MTSLAVNVGGITLSNPVMPASGTFSEGLSQVFDLNLLGALVLKTVTRELREGNPLPRVAEVPNGLINSIGIPSKGIEEFVAHSLAFYRRFKPPLLISISAPTPPLFASLAQELSLDGVAGIEVNLSCPNLEEDGKSFAMSAASTHAVVKLIRSSTSLPIWIKLTPNAGDIAEVARAAESAGADALVVANTILAMSIDVNTFNFRLGNVMGGLSGPAVKSIVLRQVYQCAKAVRIPIIGCGGISNTDDALEYLLAGATAVQVGTATFIHPMTMPRIVSGLERFCDSRGFRSLNSIIGQASSTHIDEIALMTAEARL